MDTMSVRIREFLARSFKDYQLADDEDIFSLGFVNSLFAMQLVLFLEQTFDIVVDNEDLDLDNFRTIHSLSDLVDRKRAAVAAGV
jgi:methoxymalonate biosynthesis acyl carrier protein